MSQPGSAQTSKQDSCLRLGPPASLPRPFYASLDQTMGLVRASSWTGWRARRSQRKILRDEAFAAVRPGLARQAGEILARIHAISPATLPPLPLSSARRELVELHEVYRRDQQPRPVFEFAFRWLQDRAPTDPAKSCLVHGDFRNGNLIIGPDGIRAVLVAVLSALVVFASRRLMTV